MPCSLRLRPYRKVQGPCPGGSSTCWAWSCAEALSTGRKTPLIVPLSLCVFLSRGRSNWIVQHKNVLNDFVDSSEVTRHPGPVKTAFCFPLHTLLSGLTIYVLRFGTGTYMKFRSQTSCERVTGLPLSRSSHPSLSCHRGANGAPPHPLVQRPCLPASLTQASFLVPVHRDTAKEMCCQSL